jgi:hypothetical protein
MQGFLNFAYAGAVNAGPVRQSGMSRSVEERFQGIDCTPYARFPSISYDFLHLPHMQGNLFDGIRIFELSTFPRRTPQYLIREYDSTDPQSAAEIQGVSEGC